MLLNQFSIYFFVIIALVSILTSLSFTKIFKDYYPASHNRFIILDGLRGYLAIFVFIHHSVIWYFYLRTGGWTAPTSNFYNNLGQASVAIFFMITAFLFFSKLLNASDKKNPEERKIDWTKLYISRIKRIFPLYIFSSLIVVLIALILTNFAIVDSANFAKSIGKLLQFKTPDLNGVSSSLINAGVTWTLRFERTFYIALPIFAFFLCLNVSRLWFVIVLAITIPSFLTDNEMISLSFIGGIIAALIVRNKSLIEFFRGKIIGAVAIALLIFELNYFSSSYAIFALLPLTIFFIVVVANNNLLKFLNNRASHFLGTISYSIYLLHGIVLFLIFRFIIGFEDAKLLSMSQHFMVISIAAIILILVSSITYHFIERPFLKIKNSSK